MAKVDRIVALLENRIARGDYALRPIPPESRLAEETGVSRMTARKAVIRLVDKGLLSRSKNGRVTVTLGAFSAGSSDVQGANQSAMPGADIARTMQFGFAAPAVGSAQIDRWRIAADQAARRVGGRIRLVHYYHWDDPVLVEAADTFDGLFLVPPAEVIPASVANRLRNSHAKVVALDGDLTPVGIRSIDLIPPSSVQRLLDHLAQLGHKTIHCFNTQPVDTVVQQRIEQWSLWRAAQGMAGELLNDPDMSYGDPARHAYESMRRRLEAGPFGATAVLCITMPAAMGTMRAMYERGIQIGKDISICTANDEGVASLLCPSLTATHMPDPLPYLAVCLDWIMGAPSVGPLLSRPAEVPLFIGESTGPAPASNPATSSSR